MRLFIAEKPDLARAIVDGLGGKASRKDGYFECGDDIVTWCYGHMLALLEPEDYDEKYKRWSFDLLPIVNIPWRKKPSGNSDSKKQLKTIQSLLKKADSVVHAGDPDEEGQLLVDEILEYSNCRLPVKRLLINDNNTAVVKKAMASMKDNREFAGLSAAAEARAVGDQLYGINMSRAYTIKGQEIGLQQVLTVGRVQTPVLGLVVRRTREFNSHKSAFYYNVAGKFDFGGIEVPARYQIMENDPVDDKGRLSDEHHAKQIAESVTGKPAQVVSADTRKREQQPPLPYNLLKLQADASRKFGFKPDQVKDITQSLREKHKLITYNRSDSQYLSDEQHSDAPEVLAAIAKTAPKIAGVVNQTNPAIKSRAFNSAKVTAHHGIIPTATAASLDALSDAEQKIYMLIAQAYIAQFLPNRKYDQTTISIHVDGRVFSVRSNITTSPGWQSIYQKDDVETEDDENDLSVDIRAVKNGQQGSCVSASSEKMETRPQPLYTMASLLTDLTRVAKYIKDDRLRKLLVEKDKDKEGESGGIGTPATRDTIIANLFARGFLTEKGKSIIPTQTGNEFYDVLPDQAKFPDMTALWHSQQMFIKEGRLDTASFVKQLMVYVQKEVDRVKENGLAIKVDAPECPLCKRPMRRIRKQDKSYFWGCTGFNDGCKYMTNDKGGKPAPQEKPPVVSEVHKCASCGSGLRRRDGKKKGTYWWSCSAYPTCKQTYFDANGKPDYK